MKEKQLERMILDWLGFQPGFFWKADYSRGYSKDGAFIRNPNPYAINGVSDILGVRNGVFYAFEVKTPSEHEKIKRNYEKYSAYFGSSKNLMRYRGQIDFIEKVKREGGEAGFVSSIRDVQDILAIDRVRVSFPF